MRRPFKSCTGEQTLKTFFSHRTLLPLQYPPHTIALGSLYVAALLSSFELPPEQGTPGQRSSAELARMLNKHGDWEEQFQFQAEDLEGIYHVISFALNSS